MLCKFKACAKCRGDLVLDGDEWRCWQCGTYYYPSEAAMDAPAESKQSARARQTFDQEVRPTRVRARRSINAAISAKKRSEHRWLTKNQDIINQLNLGYSVRDISELIGRNQREIRGVKERLKDMAWAS